MTIFLCLCANWKDHNCWKSNAVKSFITHLLGFYEPEVADIQGLRTRSSLDHNPGGGRVKKDNLDHHNPVLTWQIHIAVHMFMLLSNTEFGSVPLEWSWYICVSYKVCFICFLHHLVEAPQSLILTTSVFKMLDRPAGFFSCIIY